MRRKVIGSGGGGKLDQKQVGGGGGNWTGDTSPLLKVGAMAPLPHPTPLMSSYAKEKI